MSKFVDRLGREWELELDVGLLGDIRKQAGVDFGLLVKDGQKLTELLFTDPQTFVEVLWVLVREQAESREISPESFARGFNGPAIGKATAAIVAAVADFFQRPQTAKAMQERVAELAAQIDRAGVKAILEMELNGSPGIESKPVAGSLPASVTSTHGD